MDERQQRRVNEAAENFADAIKGSYQALADRSSMFSYYRGSLDEAQRSARQ